MLAPYPVSRLPEVYRSSGVVATGMMTGAESSDGVSVGTAGLGSLLVAGLAVFVAWKFWFSPRLAPTYAARAALTKAESAKMANLQRENEYLEKRLNKIFCTVRDVASGSNCNA